MGKTIEQIRIRKTSAGIRAESSRSRFAPDPLITVPARGFWKCRTLRPDRSSHSITCLNGQKLLALWAATTEVPALVRRKEVADFGDGFEHLGEGACPDATQVSFELGERHLNWVQVGAIRGQEQEPASGLSHGFGRGGIFVGGEVVQDDDCSRLQFWYLHLCDVSRESCAIHRAFDDPWRDQSIRRQARDKGLCPPRSEGGIHDEPLSAWGPPTLAGQVGFDRGFVNEDNVVWFGRDGWHAMSDPIVALFSYPCAASLGRNQRLFLYVKPSLRRNRPIASGWA